VSNKALLVGINRYPAAPLRGCVNDITDMAQFLVDHCGFVQSDVRLLADERATRQEIMARLDWLVDGAQPGDRLFFHYSGHGAQMATRDHQGEVDGLDEVVCPVDFDWTDEHVIRDKDFRRVFGSVPEDCEFVWVSDSCHSSGLTKDVPPPNTTWRTFPVPADIQWRIDAAQSMGFKALTLPCASEKSGNLALLSGCASNDVSADSVFNGRPNGVLTHFLLQALSAADGMKAPLDLLAATVRETISATGKFRQVPGLEGSPAIIKRPFLANS